MERRSRDEQTDELHVEQMSQLMTLKNLRVREWSMGRVGGR